ncbi:MAG: LptA/OstA family protein [Pseudomonadota bacterium]
MTTPARPRGRAAAFALFAALAAAGAGRAQDAESPFGSFKHDASQPIEITADSLQVNQSAQTATFQGEVVAGQGTLRLTAERVVVDYGGGEGEGAGGAAPGTGRIERLRAEGSVFLSNGSETAKGEWADYDVSGGIVTMGGEVVLTQGENAISGQSLRIDLNAGTGEISGGRVRSVFTPPAQGDDEGN